MAYLVNWKPRKFLNHAQGWHSGSHAIAWAAITTFVRKVIPRTSNSERGIAVPRFVFYKSLLRGWGDINNNTFMGLLDFFVKKEDVLDSIFRIAEKGMYNIDYKISKEGRFELLMFDIWLAIFITDDYKTDYMQMLKRVEEYLKQMVLKLGLPQERNVKEYILLEKKDGGMMLWD